MMISKNHNRTEYILISKYKVKVKIYTFMVFI